MDSKFNEDQLPGLSSPTKRRKRALSLSEKQGILNIHKTYLSNYEGTQTERINFVSEATGKKSLDKIYNIVNKVFLYF